MEKVQNTTRINRPLTKAESNYLELVACKKQLEQELDELRMQHKGDCNTSVDYINKVQQLQKTKTAEKRAYTRLIGKNPVRVEKVADYLVWLYKQG